MIIQFPRRDTTTATTAEPKEESLLSDHETIILQFPALEAPKRATVDEKFLTDEERFLLASHMHVRARGRVMEDQEAQKQADISARIVQTRLLEMEELEMPSSKFLNG